MEIKIKLAKKESFLKRITRQTTRVIITKLTTQIVTEINVYKDKKVVIVRANIPYRFLRPI